MSSDRRPLRAKGSPPMTYRTYDEAYIGLQNLRRGVHITQARDFTYNQVRQSRVLTVGDGWIEDPDGRWNVISYDHDAQIWHCMQTQYFLAVHHGCPVTIRSRNRAEVDIAPRP